MTLREAKKLAAIARTVDNGCDVCIRAVVGELNEAFSDFVWTVDEEKSKVTVKAA